MTAGDFCGRGSLLALGAGDLGLFRRGDQPHRGRGIGGRRASRLGRRAPLGARKWLAYFARPSVPMMGVTLIGAADSRCWGCS